MNFAGLQIGVWGTGIVGSSALRFFKKNGAIVSAYDNKPLSAETISFCKKNGHEGYAIYYIESQKIFL